MDPLSELGNIYCMINECTMLMKSVSSTKHCLHPQMKYGNTVPPILKYFEKNNIVDPAWLLQNCFRINIKKKFVVLKRLQIF